QKMIDSLPIRRSGSQRGVTLFHQLSTEWACFRGDYEQALRSLSPAVDNGLMDLMWLDNCPLLKPLATDPHFQALRRIVESRARKVQAALVQPLL
ncbi:MAG TPA: hypothetical protein PKO07_16720, partial [Pseudomonadota bacterium]|nr:hypothetical protein [Pseudomonadota bacterium]